MPTDHALELHQEHLALVQAFYARTRELGIGFGNEVIMAAKVDTLVDNLYGPRVIDEETGELLEGSDARIAYEISVVQIMLDMANSSGVETALMPDAPKLYVPGADGPANRAQRRRAARGQ